jgi:hypothetical protein
MSGELTFVELGVEDVERGRRFYEGLFGWSFDQGPSGEGYVIAMPNVGGGIHGKDPGAAPYVFFSVDDIEVVAERVKDFGGTVEQLDIDGGEESITRFGRFKMCRDDQGSPFGLHQRPNA